MTRKKHSRFSFKKGWLRVPQGDVAIVREKIMKALGVASEVAFLQRKRGEIIPKVTDVEAIEAVFAEYGITDVWGTV